MRQTNVKSEHHSSPSPLSTDLKSRMVSFRLTVEEYERFREICFEHGLPSVSEMARMAIHSLAQHPSLLPAQSLEARVAEVENRVRVLSTDVRRVISQVETLSAHELKSKVSQSHS